jgi:hypothetical protein
MLKAAQEDGRFTVDHGGDVSRLRLRDDVAAPGSQNVEANDEDGLDDLGDLESEEETDD